MMSKHLESGSPSRRCPAFRDPGPGKGLNLVHDIPHPEGTLRNNNIGVDKRGRNFDSRGQARHALGT